jgi:hypothetical protein
MKMNKKTKIIIILLVVGALLFSVVQFIIIPTINHRQEQYAVAQTDSLTHDINSVLKYKSQYIGDNSNTANLFYNLPLNNVSMKFQINSDDCSLTVNYLDTIWNIGEEKVQRDLVYNSAAAFSLIDNLTKITYEFSGKSYSFTRSQFENAFGTPLSSLLNQKVWSEKIQSKLDDTTFVEEFY